MKQHWLWSFPVSNSQRQPHDVDWDAGQHVACFSWPNHIWGDGLCPFRMPPPFLWSYIPSISFMSFQDMCKLPCPLPCDVLLTHRGNIILISWSYITWKDVSNTPVCHGCCNTSSKMTYGEYRSVILQWYTISSDNIMQFSATLLLRVYSLQYL